MTAVLTFLVGLYFVGVIVTWPFAWYQTPTSWPPLNRRVAGLVRAAGWPVLLARRLSS